MKTLVINFDILFHHYRPLFTRVAPSEFEQVFAEAFQYDANVLLNIAKLLKTCGGQVKTAESIVDFAEQVSEPNDITYIGYEACNHCSIIEQDKCREYNWSGWLREKELLSDFVWVAPPSAARQENITTYRLSEIPKLFGAEYDEIWLIRDKSWTTYRFQHLYDLIVEVFK